jgi:hypothetical protein
MEAKLTDIQKMLETHHILICFSGRFSQGLIEEMGMAVKNRMESEARSKSAIHNVFSIYIEQTQNIKNYTSRKKGSQIGDIIADSSSIVCIGTLDEAYFICSGNLIENSDVELLRAKLDLIAGLNKDQLKQLYKEQLKKEIISGDNGAGIGLIEIARKASLPVEYSFDRVDDNFSFYEIKVVI